MCAHAVESSLAENMAAEVDSSPAPQSRREKELAATRKLIGQAEDLMDAVDKSYFMIENKPRQYPKFDRNEITFGPVLGVGGFGIVFEVSRFTLKIPEEVDVESLDQRTSKEELCDGIDENNPTDIIGETKEEMGCLDTSAQPTENITFGDSQTTIVSTGAQVGIMDRSPPKSLKMSEIVSDDEIHYQIVTARQHMCENARRNGNARYAVKRLHRDLVNLERARGMIDLAIEAELLSALWHPNIGKIDTIR